MLRHAVRRSSAAMLMPPAAAAPVGSVDAEAVAEADRRLTAARQRVVRELLHLHRVAWADRGGGGGDSGGGGGEGGGDGVGGMASSIMMRAAVAGNAIPSMASSLMLSQALPSLAPAPPPPEAHDLSLALLVARRCARYLALAVPRPEALLRRPPSASLPGAEPLFHTQPAAGGV